jgi:hypothetical protein
MANLPVFIKNISVKGGAERQEGLKDTLIIGILGRKNKNYSQSIQPVFK